MNIYLKKINNIYMKGLLFIGANDMREIEQYIDKYQFGYFIEPIPETFNILKKNIELCNNKLKPNYLPLNNWIRNENKKEYSFNIYGELRKKKETQYGNTGASSSIFKKKRKTFLT